MQRCRTEGTECWKVLGCSLETLQRNPALARYPGPKRVSLPVPDLHPRVPSIIFMEITVYSLMAAAFQA